MIKLIHTELLDALAAGCECLQLAFLFRRVINVLHDLPQVPAAKEVWLRANIVLRYAAPKSAR